jgi:hypothetical protein
MTGNGKDRSEITYTLLPSKDWKRLQPIFEKLNAYLPSDFTSAAAVALNQEGEIVGLNMLQLVLHCEPLWVDQRYSGRVNFLRLFEMLETFAKFKTKSLVAPGYLLVAPNEKIEKMAQLAGFHKLEGTVWVKQFTQED